MSELAFILTVFFMLLGPVKLIPAFGGATRDTDLRFKRSVAIRATLIAAVLCVLLALAGEYVIGRYRISMDALRLSGGLILVIASLNGIFKKTPPPAAPAGSPGAMQLAASPVAVPGIVPPAGVAAILIFMMLAPQYPGTPQAVAIALVVVMVLNFLTMYFIDALLKPAVMLVLVVFGSALGFVQLALGVELIVRGLGNLGLFQG